MMPSNSCINNRMKRPLVIISAKMLMRNMLVHGVRLIYPESSQIHTEHCGQQDNPIHALPLWYSKFCEVGRRALRGFYLNVGLFNVLYRLAFKLCIDLHSICIHTYATIDWLIWKLYSVQCAIDLTWVGVLTLLRLSLIASIFQIWGWLYWQIFISRSIKKWKSGKWMCNLSIVKVIDLSTQFVEL